MARYRGGDGHYADVEYADAELERYLVLNALRVGNDTQRSAFRSWLRGLTRAPPAPQPPCVEVTAAVKFLIGRAMKIERFAGHHEAREALVLSVASVTAIMVTAYLLLLILY
jgi:hypothetical protein